MKVRTREGRLDSFQITLYLLLKCKNNYFPALSLTGLEILLYEYPLFFFFFNLRTSHFSCIFSCDALYTSQSF